jgi:hypothetical protein
VGTAAQTKAAASSAAHTRRRRDWCSYKPITPFKNCRQLKADNAIVAGMMSARRCKNRQQTHARVFQPLQSAQKRKTRRQILQVFPVISINRAC